MVVAKEAFGLATEGGFGTDCESRIDGEFKRRIDRGVTISGQVDPLRRRILVDGLGDRAAEGAGPVDIEVDRIQEDRLRVAGVSCVEHREVGELRSHRPREFVVRRIESFGVASVLKRWNKWRDHPVNTNAVGCGKFDQTAKEQTEA